MEIWQLPAPTSGFGNGSCRGRRDHDTAVEVDHGAGAFDVQAAAHAHEQQLVSQACCTNKLPDSFQSGVAVPASPVVIQDPREVSAEYLEEAWPLPASSDPARICPANLATQQLESHETQAFADSSCLQFDPAAAPGSIMPSTLVLVESPTDIPEILDQQHGHAARFQINHCDHVRPYRKRYIILEDRNEGTGSRVCLLPPAENNNTLGAGPFDHAGPAAVAYNDAPGTTTIAMAYAAIQEMRRSCSAAAAAAHDQVPAAAVWKPFLGNEGGSAAGFNQTIVTYDDSPAPSLMHEEPESCAAASSCGSHIVKETDDLEAAVLLSFDEEMSSTGGQSSTPAPPDILLSDTRTSSTSTSMQKKNSIYRIKSEVEEAVIHDKYDQCAAAAGVKIKRSSYKRQKRFRNSAHKIITEVDDDEEVNSCPRRRHDQLQLDENKTSCRGSRSLQAAAGLAHDHALEQCTSASTNRCKTRSVISGGSCSLELLTAAEVAALQHSEAAGGSSEEEEDEDSTKMLRLRNTVNVLRGMIPGGEDMTETSLVLDEAIHYVQLLQLHVQMLESQRMVDPRLIHTW